MMSRALAQRCQTSVSAPVTSAPTFPMRNQSKQQWQTRMTFMGGITLAVNCAGIATAGRTLGRDGPWPSRKLFSRVINVNLVGSYNVTKEAAAFMQHNEPNA